ncbi:MAG: glycosyltransferase family 2 protein, partial [Proteobacteria bacterium]
MKPKISVIMPVYNSGKYLKIAIDSILDQTEKSFELIVINDGSSDDSEAIIRGYSDQRIRYLKNEQNSGLCFTLNRGFEEATGEFIARMDGDDISLPTRFERQLSLMERDGLDACGCNWFIINDAGFFKRAAVTVLDRRFFRVFLFYGVPFAHGSVMLRKAFIDRNSLKYGTIFKRAEDHGLWSEMLLNGATFGNCFEALFLYRESAGSLSQVFGRRITEDVRGIRDFQLRSWRNELVKDSLE